MYQIDIGKDCVSGSCPGVTNFDGHIVRILVTDVHQTLSALDGDTDAGLEEWIRENSRLRVWLAHGQFAFMSPLLL